jgi:type III secretion protein J
LASFALVGCKEVLYSNLGETEVNEMVAILQAADVSSDRTVDKDGNYSLLVEKYNIGPSVVLLRGEGLPRKKFNSLGDVFSDEGIVGTPFEERARFMYALHQELSETISSIDGVRDARVHVVLPETQRFDREQKQASAAVAIHHFADFDAHALVPTIKTLLEHSVPDLAYENVSVALFSSGGARLMVTPVSPGGTSAASQDRFEFPVLRFGSDISRYVNGSSLFLFLFFTLIPGMVVLMLFKAFRLLRRTS